MLELVEAAEELKEITREKNMSWFRFWNKQKN